MYLGFLSLYLITSDLSIFSPVHQQWDYQLLHTNDSDIDVKSYCDNRPCVVKCCDYGQVLNYVGTCDDAAKFKEYSQKMDYNSIHLYFGDEVSEPKETKQDIRARLLFAQNATILPDRYMPEEFYILEDGSLNMKVRYPTKRWIEAPPLTFCLDFSLNYTTAQQKHLPATVKMIENDNERAQPMDQLKFVIAGMVLSLFLVVLLLSRISARIRSTIAPIVIALTFTTAAGYILKITQLYALSAGIPKFRECSIFSSAYYFFIISNFFWSNILIFDLWWRIRSYSKHRRNFHHRDYVRFVLYCLCGWGVPLLMTFASMAINMSALNKILPIEKPPFDSCFTKEMPTLLYLHVPIAILTIANCVLFSMLLYYIMQLKQKISNSPHYKAIGSPKLITTKRKIHIVIKMIAVVGVIGVIGVLQCVPGLPAPPRAAVIAYSVHLWTMLFCLLVLDNSPFEKLTKRFKSNHHLSSIFQASEFLKVVASNTANVSLRKEDDTEQIINKYDNIDV